MIPTKVPSENRLLDPTPNIQSSFPTNLSVNWHPASAVKAARWLIAWFDFPVGGGIGRFINIAQTLAPFGFEVQYLSISGNVGTAWPNFPGPILTLEEAESQTWDAVMVPGAGEVHSRLEQFAVLQNPCFGTRVQHILGDTTRFSSFEVANQSFKPHLVVINNSHWKLKDLKKFQAEGFHFLPGAVDTNLFRPQPYKTIPHSPPNWKIGGYATKNPGPIFEAFNFLPENFTLHLYGRVLEEDEGIANELIRQGRLFVYGPLYGGALASFYQQMDIVVTSDLEAGWSNTAAEASACGTPCIVSPSGTSAFADHLSTALVLGDISGHAISDAVLRLASDPTLMKGIATRGAARIRTFSWEKYCARLIEIVQSPRIFSYYRIPEFNLWGKWDPILRFKGLVPIFEAGPNATVLDLGAAEGIAGYLFSKYGIRVYHGFEFEESRVAIGKQLLAATGIQEHIFNQADLSDWSKFHSLHKNNLLEKYAVVLFLGLYHHLPEGCRKEVLLKALERSGNWFAIRTPEGLAKTDGLLDLIKSQGFTAVSQLDAVLEENMGWLGIFKRSTPE